MRCWTPVRPCVAMTIASAASSATTCRISTAARPYATRVAVETRVAYGRAAVEILQVVADEAADAIVMATHGRTGVQHLIYGSVAEAILAATTVPVLLVQPRAGEAPSQPFDPIHARVMVPLDGSAFAESALPRGAEFAGSAGELMLVSVVEEPTHVERDEAGRPIAYLDQQEEAATRGARDYLADIAARLRLDYPGL